MTENEERELYVEAYDALLWAEVWLDDAVEALRKLRNETDEDHLIHETLYVPTYNLSCDCTDMTQKLREVVNSFDEDDKEEDDE